MEKTKAVKINISRTDKAKQAIIALELMKNNVKTSGRMKYTYEQTLADIKDIDNKINIWQKYLTT